MTNGMLPTPLQSGDRILLIAPGKGVDHACVDKARKTLERVGLQVIESPHLLAQANGFAGTDTQRLDDLQTALDSSDIQAIYCVRGGYGCLRLIDHVQWDGFKKHPKWLIGYSDICVLHAALWHHTHYASLHAEMPIHLQDDALNHKEFQTLWNCLQGAPSSYQWEPHPLNRTGTCQATLVGGNLTTLTTLMESPESLQTDGCILFIEEVGEALYAIDRLLVMLKRSGKLSHLAALIVGHISDIKDLPTPEVLKAYELVAQHVQDYSYPLAFGFPGGHQHPNYALTLGRIHRLTVGNTPSLHSQ